MALAGAAELSLGLGVLAALLCGVAGALVPRLVAALPEPEPAAGTGPDAAPEAERDTGLDVGPGAAAETGTDPEAEPKELYADIARRPGLAPGSAIAAALTGGAVGAVVGPQWSLVLLLPLIPVGVALAVIDWRTRLLPTRLIAPSYLVLTVLALLGWLVTGGTDDLVRAGWGWLIAGGLYFLLWLLHPRGMGYGDVRLSGVLGIALGHLGWGPLLVGIYGGFLLGGLGGGLLAALRIVERRAFPFGPFMLIGAWVGVLCGDPLAELFLR